MKLSPCFPSVTTTTGFLGRRPVERQQVAEEESGESYRPPPQTPATAADTHDLPEITSHSTVSINLR